MKQRGPASNGGTSFYLCPMKDNFSKQASGYARYRPGYTAELEALQIAQYKRMFDVMKQYKKHISSVTFWNVTDRGSWLDGRAQGGGAATSTAGRIPRKAYPLLFDVNGQRKKAYWAVVNK